MVGTNAPAWAAHEIQVGVLTLARFGFDLRKARQRRTLLDALRWYGEMCNGVQALSVHHAFPLGHWSFMDEAANAPSTDFTMRGAGLSHAPP